MDELTIQTLIKAKFSGSATEMSTYISLAIQTAAIIFGGIVLWRMSSLYHKKKLAERSRTSYFETPYSKGWKKRN